MFPIVKPVPVIVKVPQTSEVSVPQPPPNNCISGFVKLLSRLLIVTVCVVLDAVKLNHTS